MFKNIKNYGFTLIELLVVVLIIGILAAIALPQYQRSVWKSRAAQLRLSVRDLALAQERYFLETGGYAASFDSLDIQFPDMTNTSFSAYTWTISSKIGNDKFGLMIDANAAYGRVFSLFLNGTYEGGAIVYFLKNGTGSIGTIQRGQTYCAETISSPAYQQNFCNKIMGTSAASITLSNGRYYPLP